MQDKTNEAASVHLGKKVSGSETYDKTLLVRVPRIENRKLYNIQNDNLPFEGRDIWHAYEFSCLTQSGMPVTRLMKINYNCENEFIIESKSLKLYLNSFNMMRFGKTITDALNTCKKMIENDLSEMLETEVKVNFLDNSAKRVEIFKEFKNIADLFDETSLKIDKFKEAPELIELEETGITKEYYLTFDSLRSNCRVTHQPDFGDAFIYYKSNKHIKEDSLAAYLTSFRSEYHFHEECCEMIFKRIYDRLNADDELFVCALYTRRGGIDICPARRTKNCKIEDFDKLCDITVFARNGVKQ